MNSSVKVVEPDSNICASEAAIKKTHAVLHAVIERLSCCFPFSHRRPQPKAEAPDPPWLPVRLPAAFHELPDRNSRAL